MMAWMNGRFRGDESGHCHLKSGRVPGVGDSTLEGGLQSALPQNFIVQGVNKITMIDLHPLVIHFAIAPLALTLLFQYAALKWPDRGLQYPAQYSLWVGLVGAVAAVITGILTARGVPADSPAQATIFNHRLAGFVTLGYFVLYLLLRRWLLARYTGRPALFLVLAIIGLGIVVTTGFFGGELVYTFGIGVGGTVP